MPTLLNGNRHMVVLNMLNGAQLVFEEAGDLQAKSDRMRKILEEKGIFSFVEESAHHTIRAETVGSVSVIGKERFEQLQQRMRLMQAGSTPRVQ